MDDLLTKAEESVNLRKLLIAVVEREQEAGGDLAGAIRYLTVPAHCPVELETTERVLVSLILTSVEATPEFEVELRARFGAQTPNANGDLFSGEPGVVSRALIEKIKANAAIRGRTADYIFLDTAQQDPSLKFEAALADDGLPVDLCHQIDPETLQALELSAEVFLDEAESLNKPLDLNAPVKVDTSRGPSRLAMTLGLAVMCAEHEKSERSMKPRFTPDLSPARRLTLAEFEVHVQTLPAGTMLNLPSTPTSYRSRRVLVCDGEGGLVWGDGTPIRVVDAWVKGCNGEVYTNPPPKLRRGLTGRARTLALLAMSLGV